MSENPNNENSEVVFPPEPEDFESSSVAEEGRKRGFSPMVKLLLASAAGIALLVGGMVWSVSEQMDGASRAVRAPAIDATPGGDVQASSERFRDRLEQSNDEKAARARELGVTYLPTPEGILKPVEPIVPVEPVVAEPEPKVQERKPISAPPAPPPIVRKPVTEVKGKDIPEVQMSTPAQQQKDNKFAGAMASQMAAISKASAPLASMRFDVQLPEPDEVQAESGADVSGAAGGVSTERIFRPGDLLYAESLVTVSSDAESPILVEVTAGEWKGSRLVGEFDVDDSSDRLVVTFSTMSLPDGRVLGIEALAVDGRSAEAAVASDVDRRFVARYGPIFAASFIGAFADAVSQRAETQTTSGDSVIVTSPEASTRQAIASGVSSASKVIASDIMANSPSGPKITLRAGYPLAIMIISSDDAPLPAEDYAED